MSSVTNACVSSNEYLYLCAASRVSLAENMPIVEDHFQSIAKMFCDFCEDLGVQKPASAEHVLCTSINKQRGHGLLFWFRDSVCIPAIYGDVLILEDGRLRRKDADSMDSDALADIEFPILQPRFQHRKKIRMGYGFTGLGMETGAKVSARATEIALENLDRFDVLPYTEQVYLTGLLSDDTINNPPEVFKCRSFRLSPVPESTTEEDIQAVLDRQFFQNCEVSAILSEYGRILPDAGSHQPKDLAYSAMILEFNKTPLGDTRLDMFRKGLSSAGFLQISMPGRPQKTKITPLGQEAAGIFWFSFHVMYTNMNLLFVV